MEQDNKNMRKITAYSRICGQIGPNEFDMFLEQIELDESEPISKLIDWMSNFDNITHSNFVVIKKEN